MVTIPVAYKPSPLQTAATIAAGTDARTAPQLPLALREGIDKLESYINGMCRVIRCTAAGTNLITLTADEPAPLIEGYKDYDIYVAVAENDSTGAVTATLVPEFGTLTTVKVYKDGGATQAGAGDILQNRLYHFTFADHLDGGVGGLVAK